MDDSGRHSPNDRDADAESSNARPRLRVVQGGGQPKPLRIDSRHDLASVLVGAAADMLLKRISAPRAHEIERQVERLMELFDRVDREPLLERVLRRELDSLEALVRDSARRPGRPR